MAIGDDFVVGRGVEVAETTQAHAILVSHPEHLITPVAPGAEVCPGVDQARHRLHDRRTRFQRPAGVDAMSAWHRHFHLIELTTSGGESYERTTRETSQTRVQGWRAAVRSGLRRSDRQLSSTSPLTASRRRRRREPGAVPVACDWVTARGTVARRTAIQQRPAAGLHGGRLGQRLRRRRRWRRIQRASAPASAVA